MKIITAEKRHLELIPDLITACIADMESQGINQWDDNYPTLDYFEKDIYNKALHVIEGENELIGIITFDEFQDEEYKDVQWLTDGGKNLVIHRLVVDPKWQGRGIAQSLMDYAENYAIANGYISIRLDAFSANPRVLRFYEKRGYTKTGQIFFPRRDIPFNTFEKIFL